MASLRFPYAFCLYACLVFATRARSAEETTEVKAVTGKTFNVGRIQIHGRPPPQEPQISRVPVWVLSDDHRRALYPAYGSSADGNGSATILFLFKGESSFALHLRNTRTGEVTETIVRPESGQSGEHTKLLAEWWAHYAPSVSAAAGRPGTHAFPESYLASMLSRRLGLKYVSQEEASGEPDLLTQQLGLFLGTESIRLSLMTKSFLGTGDEGGIADKPLPAGIAPPSVTMRPLLREPDIEPLARCVPVECFYVHLPAFPKLGLLRTRLERWGGDLQQLVRFNGLDYDIKDRLERQLALAERDLATWDEQGLLGAAALIGFDTFFREGAAVGLLLEAKAADRLDATLKAYRRRVAETGQLETTEVQIAGVPVDYVCSKDRRVRSFFVRKGDYFLITNTRALAARFIEAERGRLSLAADDGFRHARALFPLGTGEDTFVFLSDPFIRNLLSPAYRIEMSRRMRALEELEMYRLAKLAAEAEGYPGADIEALIQLGFLPRAFGMRPDRSCVVPREEGPFDLARGYPGTFLPIPDMKVDSGTAAEVKAYQSFALDYRMKWDWLDPVAIQAHSPRKETNTTLQLDIHLLPYAQQRYAQLAMILGPRKSEMLRPISGSIAHLEARIGGLLGNGSEWNWALGGIDDFEAEVKLDEGGLALKNLVERWPWHCVGTPSLATALLRTITADKLSDKESIALDLPTAESPDKPTVVRWARRSAGVVIMSTSRERTDQIATELAWRESEPAQVHLRIANLSKVKAHTLCDAASYLWSREVSLGNVRLLDLLDQQCKVPVNRCLQTAGELLNARLVCPGGGAYCPRTVEDGICTTFVNTRFTARLQEQVPQDWRFPLLDWIQGLEVGFSIQDRGIRTRIELKLSGEAALAP